MLLNRPVMEAEQQRGGRWEELFTVLSLSCHISNQCPYLTGQARLENYSDRERHASKKTRAVKGGM